MSAGSTTSQRLAEFISELQLGDLPVGVRTLLPSLVRDQVACQVMGAGLWFNALVRDYALDESASGHSTVIGATRQIRPESAAFANATAGHGLEMDDTHATALAHPGCVVVPTVLASGEDLEAKGHAALTALAAGYEIAVRIGLSVQPSMVVSRGFHETCVLGVFGAAAACGRLIGLDRDQMVAAFAIAGSHASGTIEYAQSGGEVKRLHAGLGAMGGIRAARLASRGLTGPPTIFEGRRGILQAVADAPNQHVITADLGVRWHFNDLFAKEFCCAATIHGPIRALRNIMSEHQLEAEDIARIVVGVDDFSARHLGTLGWQPRDMAGAQFNLQYSLAMQAVLGGNGPVDYLHVAEVGFADPRILQLARRIKVEVDDESTEGFPLNLTGCVRVECVDGAVFSARARANLQWDSAFVSKRFEEVFALAYSAETGEGVGRGIDGLAENEPVRHVLAPLRGPLAMVQIGSQVLEEA